MTSGQKSCLKLFVNIKLIFYEINERFQEPDALVAKNIQSVFVKSCYWNKDDESISLFVDMYKTAINWGEFKVQLREFSSIIFLLKGTQTLKLLWEKIGQETVDNRSFQLKDSAWCHTMAFKYLI